MKNIYIKAIAERLQIKEWQVENCVGLFEEGGDDTIYKPLPQGKDRGIG